MNVVNPLSIDALKQKRKALSDERKRRASDQAFNYFSNLSHLTLSFAPIGSEIDLWPLNHLLAKKGLLALPRVENDSLFCYFVNDLHHLIISKWSILEPDPKRCKRVSIEELHTILVPGLAFDSFNHRLGYGKGFYDRLLHHHICEKTIGVGFKEQLLDEPIQTHEGDVSLDLLSLF